MTDKLIYSIREDILEDVLEFLGQNNIEYEFFELLAPAYLAAFSYATLSRMYLSKNMYYSIRAITQTTTNASRCQC